MKVILIDFKPTEEHAPAFCARCEWAATATHAVARVTARGKITITALICDEHAKIERRKGGAA